LCCSFEKTVLESLSLCFTGKQGKRLFLAALSGGADSTALTAALASLREKAEKADSGDIKNLPPFELHALHVNHGIRPPGLCSADEQTAAALCNKLNIPFNVAKIPPGEIQAHANQYGTGIEAAARYFRYRALEEEARRIGADLICTAHTADDRLETILMAFLRGAGPSGLGALAGTQLQTELSSGLPPYSGNISVPIARPLLSLSRADVLAYIKERGLSYCTDETNEDEHFLRNKIRRLLVPFLDEHFPHWRAPVLRLGETQAMAAAFISEEAKKRLPWVHEGGETSPAYCLSAEMFFSEPGIIREEALFQVIDSFIPDSGEYAGHPVIERKKPRRETIRSFIRGGDISADLGPIRLENKNGRITVKKNERAPGSSGFSVLIKKAGVYKLNDITVIAKERGADSEESAFFAGFPLVLYSSGDGKIFAEDQKGRAAEICFGGLVWKREISPENGNGSFTIRT